MYKIYSGDKCILISAREEKPGVKGGVRVVAFTTAELLHKEYSQFVRSSKFQVLNVTGDMEKAWRVFRSLFSYIEAAGGMVLNPKGELLMIYRNKHWDLPKGKMEKGEVPEETAVREVEEECGVKHLKIVKELKSSFHIFHLNKNACMKRTYWFQMTSKDTVKPVPQKEEGIQEAKWMPKAEVEKVRSKVYLSLREVLDSI